MKATDIFSSGGRRRACWALAAALLLCGGADGADEPAAAVLEAGKAALEDGLDDVAQAQLERYLKIETLSKKEIEDGTLLLIRAMQNQGKSAEVLELYKAKKAWLAKVDRPDAFAFGFAMALHGLGKHEEALAETADFEKKYPASDTLGRIVRLRAWCHLKTGKADAALEAFARFARDYPESPEWPANLLEWSKALASLNRTRDAADKLAQLCRLPGDLREVQEGHYWLGQLLISEKKWEEAASVLSALAENRKATADFRSQAMFSLALAMSVTPKKGEAVAVLQRGIELARSPEIKRRGTVDLGRLLIDLEKMEEGVALLKAFIAASPADPLADTAQLRLAVAMLDRKKYAEAADEYQHYLETFTNSAGQAEAHYGRGWALGALGRHAEATTEYSKALALATNPAKKEECLFKMGDAYFANGQFKLASETYDRFIRDYPASAFVPLAVYQAAESFARAGDNPEAARRFEAAAGSYATNSVGEEALLRLAEIRQSEGRLEDAVKAFDRLASLNSNSVFRAQALCGRGMANYQMLKWDNALADFSSVVTMFPTSRVVEQSFYMRGMCLYLLNRDEDAVAVCRDFLARFPGSRWAPDVTFWIAKYLFNEGSYEAASREFEGMATNYPGNPLADDALLWAGLAASKHKGYVRTVELLNRLVKDYPASRKIPEARFAQVEALSPLNKFAEAILLCDEIITKYPESSLVIPALGKKGDLHFSMAAKDDPKRFEESLACYRAVANSPKASLDMVLQAEYKIGKCLEKLGKPDEAFQQYYVKVIVAFLEGRERNVRHDEACQTWFTRAVFDAADILEGRKDWRKMVSVLERAVKAGVPRAEEAQARIDRIKSEHWLLFYK